MAIARVNLYVDIGTADDFHAVGYALPTGAAIVSAALNVESALTGAGGADRIGLIHTTGSPNLYLETAALTQNTKDSEVYTSLTLTDGEALYIAAMTGSVAYGGTVAGGNDADVRILLRTRVPDTLPDA